jgi:glycosyltransferase involved in cell wall biosynthesis
VSKLVYVALGPVRVRAAEQHAARLAGQGVEVELVVPDIAPWSSYQAPAGVTVHKVDRAHPLAGATRLLRARRGPLRGADELIAGDQQALPAAWAATKRFSRLPVHFEPTINRGRRPAPADLAVVTPWYPSPYDPFNGSFVRSALGAVRDQVGRVSILHGQAWSYPHGSPVSSDRIGVIGQRLAARFGNAIVEDMPEGELTRFPVPVLTRSRDYGQWADDHVDQLRAALPTGRIEATLIHAHTGIYGGYMATHLARPDARLIVTEHASFLPAIFDEPAWRNKYEEVLERADQVLCVSPHLLETVLGTFPHYVDKFSVVPNVVDFADFAVRPAPPGDLLRWLYVGRMQTAKGVKVLLEAFARVAAEEPAATLTLVGNGELDGYLRGRVTELGLGERVSLRPPVPPEQVAGLMHEHDVLVHASKGETFGMTVVEAIATETPVLVARSLGPEATLSGLEGTAGLLFDISDDPDVIVDAYRELRKRMSGLDLPTARVTLLARYGRESVASRLMDAYQSSPAEVEPIEPNGANAMMIAVNPPNYNRARDLVHHMIGAGFTVDLVTVEPSVWRRIRLDQRVRVHTIGEAESRRPLLWTEQLMVVRAPTGLLGAARRLTRRLHSVGPETNVVRLQKLHTRAAALIDNKLFGRAYQVFRPRGLWRIARRRIMPELDLSRTQHVIVTGTSGVTIAWRLAHKYPHLTVTTSMIPPEPPQ